MNFLCSWGILLIARGVSEMKDHPAASLRGFCCGLTHVAFCRALRVKLSHWLSLLMICFEIQCPCVGTSLLFTFEPQNKIL